MSGKCKIDDCAAPLNCHLGKEDCTTCENFIQAGATKSKALPQKKIANSKSNIPWTGEPLTIDELSLVSSRNSPIVIGIVGKADAGKTTFIAMLYTLLLNGNKLKKYNFAGSKTLLGLDEHHSKLLIQKDSVVFPDPTPVGHHRIFHLALKDQEQKLKDVLFSDASGEVFSIWSHNREHENAEGARWIYQNSNGFMLFVDCEALIQRKNQAKTEIIDLAQQLRHDLKGRPVIVVWSKADKIDQVPEIIKTSLKSRLGQMFSNYSEIEITNFSKYDPDTLCHNNNLGVVDWLMQQIDVPTGKTLIPNDIVTNDLFLNYRGK